MDEQPLSPGEVDALLAPLGHYGVVVLAVSGGGDSSALMHLAAQWRRRCATRARLIAATVDHGLRPAAALEAATVARWAAAAGLEHRTLVWEGGKPATGIQAAAREARYGLLARLARDERGAGALSAIVTAHTADDQAETVLMRLMRGSGVDGLAAIPARTTLVDCGARERCSVDVLRPLIGVSRRRLEATLAAGPIPHLSDPSNEDRRFERVRVRTALAQLEPLGLGRDALARTATRLQRAQAALAAAAEQLWREAVSLPFGVAVSIDRYRCMAAPEEIGIRVLRRALALMGGAARPAELSAVEDAYSRLRRLDSCAFVSTLGGTIMEVMPVVEGRNARICIYREPDRNGGLCNLRLKPGTSAIWDDRFEVGLSSDFPIELEVGPLADAWGELSRQHPRLAECGLPAGVMRGLPAWRREGGLVGVPTLADIAFIQGDETAASYLRGPMLAVPGPSPVPALRVRVLAGTCR